MITFANNECTIQSVSDTEIVCTLLATTAGDWLPVVIDVNGLIPLDPSLTNTEVPITVTGVVPTTALNPQGDNILTISGTNFPPSLEDGSTIEITLSDGTSCRVISSTINEIKCVTEKFSDVAFSVTGTVVINSKVDNTLSLTITTAPATVRTLTPSQVSPVLKADIVITIDPSFAGTLEKDDFEVFIEDVTNSSNIRALNVISVNNAEETITVKYGGAYTGVYKMIVRSISLGRFDTEDVLLTASTKITDFTPKTGSIYGGTLINILGFNFSTDGLDNNVRIGLTDCLVESSANGEVICRTEAKYVDHTNIDVNTEELVVFLKLSEEASCEAPSGNCDYVWLDDSSLPSLTSYVV